MAIHIKKLEDSSIIDVSYNEFEVSLCSFGASILSIKLDNKWMTSAFKTNKSILSNLYNGKTIGRVTNRLKGNIINIDGFDYILENNENNNTHHGGKSGLSNQNFLFDVTETNEDTTVSFSYVSPNLESGFPGDLSLKVIYIISKNKEINIRFEATTNAKTLCSLTNHTFYCLGEKSIDNLAMTIYSHRFLHPNENDLLAEDIRDINETMDFNIKKLIVKNINDEYLMKSKTKGYDHFYYFDEIRSDKIQTVLESKYYKLLLKTDFSGLQIYTDNYEDNCEYLNSKNSIRKCIALEPCDSQKDLHFLDKNEIYSRFINLTFMRK